MEEMVMNGITMSAARENYISDGMIDAVEQIGNYNNGYNAIGYSYLYYVDTLVDDGGIKVLAVDGIQPTPKNLQSGKYPFTVNYYAVYRKGDTQTEAFVNWLTSDAGQKAVAAAGYVPLRGGADEDEEDEEDETEEEHGVGEDKEDDGEYIRTGNGELTIPEGTVTLGVYEGEPEYDESGNWKIDPEIKALFDLNPKKTYFGIYDKESDDVVSKVNWPSSLRVIGKNAFSGVEFDTLTLPASLERIYEDAFTDCTIGTLRIECNLPYEQVVYMMWGNNNIGAFEAPEDHPLFTTIDGVLYTKDGKTLLDYPQTREDTHFDVPEGVENIAYNAFYNDNLISVSLPGSIKTIGQYAFGDCDNLTTVELSEGIETIGEWAFYKCENLTSMTLPDGLKTIEMNAFHECAKLKTISIPESVTEIRESAFAFSGLKSVTIPKGVTTIERYTFCLCRELEEVILHDGITTIGNNAFSSCKKLTSITLPENLETIGEEAFQGSEITSITIPENVVSIGEEAFYSCIKLENITLNKGLKSIGDKAFSQCDGLTEVVIPDGVTSIGKSAFAYCDNLLCVIIPDSVTSIGEELFFICQKHPYCIVSEGSYAQEYCKEHGITCHVRETETSAEDLKPEFPYRSGDFRYVVLSDGTAAIVRADTGAKCVIPKELDGYTVSAVGLHYSSYDVHEINRAVEIEDAERHFFRGVVNPECTSIEIPDTVKTIGFLALYGCKDLKTVTLPKGLTAIGYYAFEGTGLTSVDIPESVTYIGIYAFKDCEQLTEIVIPGSVEQLTDGVLESCGSLKAVTIQEGVRVIDGSVCGYCQNLQKVVLPESMTKMYEYAFLLCDHVTCVVPAGSYAEEWCKKNEIPYTIKN